jgi:PAS domain S-box-containing protein
VKKTTMTNRLLSQQLRHHLGINSQQELAAWLGELIELAGEPHATPRTRTAAAGLAEFFTQVEASYEQAEHDRVQARRGLELGSSELTGAHPKLRAEAALREGTLESLRETTNRLLAPLGRRLDEHEDLQALSGHLDELTDELLITRRELEQTLKELGNRQFALDQHAIVSITDPAGRITYANQRFCDISGYSREELLGRDHRLINSGYHDAAFFCTLWQTIQSGQMWHGQLCDRARDGALFWVEASIVPICDEAGQVLQYVAIRTDITAHKRLKENLRREQRFLQSVMDTLGEGLYTIDAQGLCTFVNRKAETMLGWSRAELEGRNMHDLIHYQKADGAPLHKEQCAILSCIRDGRACQSDADFFTRRDGTLFAVSLVASPLLENDRPVGSVVAFQDITERKRFEAEILRAKESAEQANRAKGDFLATVSHEIRTPMNGIIGMTDLALDTDLSREQREYLVMVKNSADSLLDIINDILDFSKIEAGHIELECIAFRAHELIATALRPLGVRAQQKGLELVYEAQPEIPETLLGDPGRLRQILVNLVGNAIKFSRTGDIRIHVGVVQLDAAQVVLRFSVRDRGIGIAPQQQQTIFAPFTQADTSTTRRFGGTGLGLAICARLVEAMGGEIGVDSAPGRGSTFHFTVRLGIGASDHREPLLLAGLAGARVLVVDDHAANRHLLVNYLLKWGLQPHALEDGAAALAALDEAHAAGKPFRVILLDAMMPGIDGFEVARRIKARAAESSTIIMMLTSGGQRGDAQRCRELGLAAYLSKPIRAEELQAAVLSAAGARASGASVPLITRHSLAQAHGAAAPVPLRILLAEDNPVNQRLALTLLQKRGHTVQLAGNGREAVAYFDAGAFDLILMDMQMPVLDGLEATRQIRELENLRGGHVRIVAMTANAMSGDKDACLEAGMDDYLAKPLKVDALLAILHAPPGAARDAHAAPNSAAALPFDYLGALAQGDRLMIEVMARPFRNDRLLQLGALRHAVQAEDRKTLLGCAHALKVVLGHFRATPAQALARKLELLAAQGDFGQAMSCVEALAVALEQLEQALLAFVQRAP